MVKVAAIQVSASPDLERNVRKAAQYLEIASQRGASIACFPELFAQPWIAKDDDRTSRAHAQPADGPLVTEVAALARQFRIAVVCPFFERATDGVYHNSATVVDSRGTVVGLYRKIHLPDIPNWREKAHFCPGDKGFSVQQIDGVRVGVQIGWDNFFPEGFRCLALAGAQVVFVPTAAAFASQERWLAMAVSHAVANGLFVIRVNRVGSEAGLDFYGGSFAVRPDGELCTHPLGVAEGALVVDCELSDVERARLAWPFLGDRRPRQYARVAGIEWGPGLLPEEEGQAPQVRGAIEGSPKGERPPPEDPSGLRNRRQPPPASSSGSVGAE
jgi:N-carbamoylputrescine amidase